MPISPSPRSASALTLSRTNLLVGDNRNVNNGDNAAMEVEHAVPQFDTSFQHLESRFRKEWSYLKNLSLAVAEGVDVFFEEKGERKVDADDNDYIERSVAGLQSQISDFKEIWGDVLPQEDQRFLKQMTLDAEHLRLKLFADRISAEEQIPAYQKLAKGLEDIAEAVYQASSQELQGYFFQKTFEVACALGEQHHIAASRRDIRPDDKISHYEGAALAMKPVVAKMLVLLNRQVINHDLFFKIVNAFVGHMHHLTTVINEKKGRGG